MSKYLITGGAGFLGNEVCRQLVKLNHEVICLDNLMTSKKTNIKDLLQYDNFEFMQWDVEDKITIECDAILNLACPASPKWYYKNPTKTMTTSLIGAINMLELARLNNAKILQFSTSEVLGDPTEHPQSETYNGNVDSTSPRSIYDESKRCCETLFMTYYRQYNADTRIVRLFNSYGPGMAVSDGRVVSNFIISALKNEPLTIYGDGSQTRSLCYRDDTIRGIFKLLDVDYHLPVNIGSEQEYTILEIAKIIKEMINPKLELIYKELPISDPKQRRPDISLARRLLGWEPRYTLNEGLTNTIDYFKNIILFNKNS